MDRASKVLAEGLPNSEPYTYAALSKYSQVSRSTLWHRIHGRPSKEENAKRQQYLTPSEEKALVYYLERMADIGYPMPIKYLRSLAFIIARKRSSMNKVVKPPGKNWPKAFEKRHSALVSRKVKLID
jgi:hypothetical protein